LRHVAGDTDGFPPGFVQCRRERQGGFLVDVGDDHLHALRREAAGQCRTDAISAAGDDRHTARQVLDLGHVRPRLAPVDGPAHSRTPARLVLGQGDSGPEAASELVKAGC
jgi:hypothetical protein